MKSKKTIICLMLLVGSFLLSLYGTILKPPLNYNYNSIDEEKNNTLQVSDIAGTDLYAENIDVYLAGNTSIIKQSMFSNDTSIFPRFDTRDPAFYKCNILISTSNGILPKAFPRLIEEQDYSSQYEMTFNNLAGFLYYDRELDVDSVTSRASRAFEIIKKKFAVDIIQLNVTDSHFLPFVGYMPNWELYLNEITGNLPMDGYWKALDLNRLASPSYYDKYHLSSTFFIVNNKDIIKDNVISSLNQVNFNLAALDLSFLESNDIETIFQQFNEIIVDYSSLFGNFSDIFEGNETTSQESFEELSTFFSSLELLNDSHYVSMMIQYEGLSNGIIPLTNDRFYFDLWTSMGYIGEALRPSEKVFIALTGAFMSNIDIKIFCTEILDVSPDYFKFYDFLLEQIGLILFYAEIEFDIETLKDYSFKLKWIDNSGFKSSYVIPVNLEDPTDFINFLHQLGLQGFPGIPSGLFNPIENINIIYEISNSEPNLLITKELLNENASLGIYNDFSFNITVRNVGNESAWGIPTSIPISLEDAFALIVGPLGVLLGLDTDLQDAIWEVVRVLYTNQYANLEDFFNYDEDPKIFYFDTTGIGLIDTYYPDVLNFTNLFPYNENMEFVLAEIELGNPQLISALNSIGISLEELVDIFTNENSVWNEANWLLEPDEFISYELSNFSISDLDSFTPFYSFNFTIKEDFPSLPSLLTGVPINESNPYMALELDGYGWQIESEEKYLDQEDLEVQFLFENDTSLNQFNKSIDRVSAIITVKDLESQIELEVFNFSREEFIDISEYLVSIENDTYTYSFIRSENSIDWLFNPETPDNYGIIIRLKGTSSEKFNISIDDFNVEFSYRDVNEYKVLGSRIIFGSASGLIEYIRISNAISLSTYEMASLISFSNVTKFISENGESNEYSLIIKNIGTIRASDINVSIQIPGILQHEQHLTVQNNNVIFTKDHLDPQEQFKVNFSFFVPNSIKVSQINVSYFNNAYIKNVNSSILETKPNDLYIIAPIDYFLRLPHVNVINIEYNASNYTPYINESIDIILKIKNESPSGLNVSSISFLMGDSYGSLERVDNNSLTIQNLPFNETEFLTISLFKHNWKGYFYPSINFIQHNTSNLIQIGRSESLILGFINFTIIKEVDKDQVEIGEIITVSLTVKNTGTICSGEVDLTDIISFNILEFNLVSGSLINNINCLAPGQNATFIYHIRAVNQNLITLKPASIEHYFLIRELITSNELTIKVMLPQIVRNLILIVPCAAAFLILVLFFWQTGKYKAKKFETERYESILLTSRSSESILMIKNTLEETIKKMHPADKKGRGMSHES